MFLNIYLYSSKYYCLDGRGKEDEGGVGIVGILVAAGPMTDGCDGTGGVAGGVETGVGPDWVGAGAL